MYFQQQGEDYYFTTKALDLQDSTLLILGSSRARNHYNPQILHDSLGMSCYNAGRSGCFLVYQAAQLDLILDRYVPKVVVLEVTPYDMNPGNADYDRLSGLLPYQHHASFEKVISRRSPCERLKCLSSIYPYNSLLLKMVKNMKDRGNFHDDGFQPLHGVWQGAYRDTNGGAVNAVSDTKKSEMMRIVKQCKANNIQLIMVTSPYYGRFSSSKTLDVTDSICKANDIPYISFLNRKEFKKVSLFSSVDHLNESGANLFSSELANLLKAYIRE